MNIPSLERPPPKEPQKKISREFVVQCNITMAPPPKGATGAYIKDSVNEHHITRKTPAKGYPGAKVQTGKKISCRDRLTTGSLFQESLLEVIPRDPTPSGLRPLYGISN
jgi:hypothetical protein